MAVLTALRAVNLPQGEIIPALGQGTWHMAEDPRRRTDEIAALRRYRPGQSRHCSFAVMRARSHGP